MLKKKATTAELGDDNSGFEKLTVEYSNKDVFQSQIAKPTKKPIIIFKNIPEELLDIDQWVFWKFEGLRKNGKQAKLPVSADGSPASSTNPLTWSSLSDLITAYKEDKSKFKGVQGIGFVITKDDPYAFIDLDNCLENGELKHGFRWIETWVDKFDTYTEISQSGKGLHIFFRVKDKSRYRSRATKEIEVYLFERYSVLTGNVYRGHRQIEERTEIFDEFLEEFKLSLKEQTSHTHTRVSCKDNLSSPFERNLRTYDAIWFEYWESVRLKAKQVTRKGKEHLWEYPLQLGRSPKRLFWDANRKRAHDTAGLPERDLLISEFGEDSEIVEAFDRLEEKKGENKKVDIKIPDFNGSVEVEYDELLSLANIPDDPEQTFLIDKLIPEKTVTVLAGEGGVGKSYITLAIASAVTRGKGNGFPFKDREPGNVLIYTDEDPMGEIKKRFQRLEGIESRCSVRRKAYDFSGKELLILRKDIEDCKPVLVILDTAWAYRGKFDLNSRNDAQKFMSLFRKFAEAYNTTFLLTYHFNSDKKSGVNVTRIAGSMGLPDYCKSALLVTRSQENKEHRFIFHSKVNYSDEGETLECRIDKTGTFEWVGYSKVKSEDWSNSRSRNLDDFILELLGGCDFMPANDVTKACKEACNATTSQIQDARERLGITKANGCIFKGKGFDGQWYWRSPENTKEATKRAGEKAKVYLLKKFNE